MPLLIDTCANCSAPIHEGKRALYDDHEELHFCDAQCFREWAEDAKVAEKVLAFYRTMNVEEVVT
jgi:ribosomal protein L24E